MWNRNNSANNNISSDAKNVNTKIKTFYSDISCMQLAYWNDKISIKINPLLSINADGLRQYDYNRRATTALVSEKCIALAEKIKENILPKIKEVSEKKTLDAAVNVGVQTGKNDGAVFFEYKNDEAGVPSVYLTVYTTIGQDGKAPKDGVYSYKFSKVNTMENYDSESGTGSDNVVEAEFMFVYNKLKNISDLFATATHSAAMDSSFVSTTGGNSGAGYNNGNTQSSTNPPYQASMQNNTMEDFPWEA